MLVTGSIPNLIDGVSQNPPTERKPTHCDLCENAYLSPSDGMSKRPPTQHVKQLSTGSFPDRPYVHFINRSETEQYVMIFQSGSVSVYDLAGNSIPVVLGGSLTPKPYSKSATDYTYLNVTGNPDQTLKAITLADTTYVLNTSVTVLNDPTQVVAFTPEIYASLLWVKQAISGGTYTATVDGYTATYTAPTSGTPTTDAIAAALGTAIQTAISGHVTATITVSGSVISICKTAAYTQVSAADSGGGVALAVVDPQGTQQFANLPPVAMGGQIVKIVSNTGNGSPVPYYVQFVISTPNTYNVLGSGTWQECSAPTIVNAGPAYYTMPHSLTRKVDSDGSITGTVGKLYFLYDIVPFEGRNCGDQTFAPDPSFINNKINDIFFWHNRLGFLSDTNVLFSQAGNFINFYRTSMLAVLDSDPIDVTANYSRPVQLRWAVPSNQDLLVIGANIQFVIPGSGTITPATIGIVPATEYDADTYCRPLPVANMVHLPFRVNGYTGIRDYYVEYYTQRRVGKSFTDHVNKYLLGNPIKMALAVSSDLTATLTDADRGSMYVYKWQWQGNTLYSADKLQSAWSRWNFDQPGVTTKIYGVYFIGITGYMVVGRQLTSAGTGGEICLEKFTVDPQPVDSDSAYTTYLDRRVSESQVTLSYNSGTNQTTITLPYAILGTPTFNVVTRQSVAGGTQGGYVVPVVGTSGGGGSNVIVNGNWTTAQLWIGEVFTMRYRFSQFYIRQPNQVTGGTTPVLTGRLQIRTITVRSDASGYYRLEITPAQRQMNSVPVTFQMGNAGYQLGQTPIASGRFRTLIGSENSKVQIDIVNDSPLPSRLSSAEWEGLYFARARRV